MDKCKSCGYKNKTGRDKCPECGDDTWVKVKSKSKTPLSKPKRKRKARVIHPKVTLNVSRDNVGLLLLALRIAADDYSTWNEDVSARMTILMTKIGKQAERKVSNWGKPWR